MSPPEILLEVKQRSVRWTPSDVLSAFIAPERRRLLAALVEPRRVRDVCLPGHSRSATSQQLGVLLNAGLVRCWVDGHNRVYQTNVPAVRRALHRLAEEVGAL